MGHFYHPPLPIIVDLSPYGVPVAVTWDGARHSVHLIAREWQEDRGWWVWRQWRAYYRLITHTGLAIEVYQDLLTHTWHLQRRYD